MSWFIYALATMLAWGGADLFYKKGADSAEKYSHLKTAIAVGTVMGLHAFYTLAVKNIGFEPVNLIKYLPVSAMYILSMTVGYFGLRYLELSISSPVQNSSGAVVCILCLLFLGDRLGAVPAACVVLICVGVLLLGIFERNRDRSGEKKYVSSLTAFMMPVLYCFIDALGTFFDAYYLDDYTATPLSGVTEQTLEDVANTSYELTFFICAVVLFIYVRLVKKEKSGFLPVVFTGGHAAVSKAALFRYAAAVLETAGQFTYVYAMSAKAVIAAPMVAAYSIVSMILSRLFLKEKLSAKQYAALALVMAGICILGIFDV